jgi:hypothetical protein
MRGWRGLAPVPAHARASCALDARADGDTRMRPRGIKDSGAPGGTLRATSSVTGAGPRRAGGGRDPWRLPGEDLLLALGIRRHGCSGNGLVQCRKCVCALCSVWAVPNASHAGVGRAAARPVLLGCGASGLSRPARGQTPLCRLCLRHHGRCWWRAAHLQPAAVGVACPAAPAHGPPFLPGLRSRAHSETSSVFVVNN